MKKIIVLAVLALATVAQATDFTVMVGDEFVMADVSLERMGPFQVGIAGAINYNIESSSVLEDFDIDFQDHMVGPIARVHVLPEDNPWALCGFYAMMFPNADPTQNSYDILGATLAYKGWGVSYQRYLNEYQLSADPNNDRLMLTWTGTF